MGFLHTNYEFMLQLFKSSKPYNFSIKNDLLNELCLDSNVSIQKLVEYKIVREQPNSEYSLYLKYRQFFEFLLDDFTPVLDESIKIYKDLIDRYFIQLREAKDPKKINNLINEIINEIDQFSIRIENNTKQLLTETRKLKANKEQSDYLIKVQKANEWIETYIKPLNDVLDKEDPNSVKQVISQIRNYASRQQFEHPLSETRNQFKVLYHRIGSINDDILKNSAIITSDLTPLIEQIKSESLILTGVLSYLDDVRNENKLSPMKLFEEVKRDKPYSNKFREEAIFLLEQEKESDNFFIYPVINENIDVWFFDLEKRERFKKELVEVLPINDFFYWCFLKLQEETTILNSQNYFAITSLLFIDEEFKKDFDIQIQTEFLDGKIQITLKDIVLNLPLVKLTKRK